MLHTETRPQLVISLSKEELFVILKLLHAPTIAGIDLSIFQDSQEHQSENVTPILNTALKALVARGYLLPLEKGSEQPLLLASSQEMRSQPWNRASLSPTVQALVSVCAFAIRSLLLSWHTKSGRDLLYVHERDGLFVIVTSLLPEVYTFTALTSWEAAWQFIAHKLSIQERTQPEPSLPRIRLRRETLMSLQKLASQPEEELQTLYTWLTQAGLPSSAAQTILETLKQVQVVAGFQVFTRGQKADDQANGKSPHRIALLLTTHTLLVAEPQQEVDETLLIRQATAQEIESMVHALWSEASAERSS